MSHRGNADDTTEYAFSGRRHAITKKPAHIYLVLKTHAKGAGSGRECKCFRQEFTLGHTSIKVLQYQSRLLQLQLLEGSLAIEMPIELANKSRGSAY